MQQKPTQECKAIFLQLKNKLEKIKKKQQQGQRVVAGDKGLGLNYGYAAKVLQGFKEEHVIWFTT